jgi:hypothetical protein
MNIQHAATGENRYVVIEKTMSGRCGDGARAGWVGVKWGRVCIEGRSVYKEAGSEKAGGEWALATIRSHELP